MSIRYIVIATVMIVLTLVAGCGGAAPTATPEPTITPIPPTATPLPPAETPTPTNTLIPPTETPTPTATPIPPTATPLPPTDTVCASGCDFTTIQAAIDNPGTADGAIIEITDPIHTEAGIVVNKSVTIRGLVGGADTIVQAYETSGEAPDRVFIVEEGTTAIFERMTIRHGRLRVQEECGGGIMNHGTLTLKTCVVRDNTSNDGAGICNSGALTLINSTVSNNLADGIAPMGYECGSGAGIKCERGMLTLINSTINNNRGEGERARGGGVHVGCNCTAVFTNSTISGNRSVVYAGGIYARGTLRLVNCTISDNNTIGEGGGIYVRGRMDYVNTIIANNTGKGGNCVIGGPGDYRGKGTIGTNSNNLVEGGGCDPDYSADPKLGPLADNGGDTKTHALLPDSPAIDAISMISCTLPTDQRGAPRPVVQTSSDTPCDIGAFELQTE